MPELRALPELLRLPLTRATAPPAGDGKTRRGAIALGLVLALAACFAPVAPWLRGVIVAPVALVAVLATRRARDVARPPAGFVVVDGRGISRIDQVGAARLADWSARFGVTVLVNEARDRGVLAFTTLEQTRYVGVRVSMPDERAAARELFARASLAPEGDLLLGARGEDLALGARDALRLVELLRARAAESLGRILLSDPRGAPVVLDGDELRVGERLFDLTSPLEWRGFTFFESAGHMSTVVQATWVRQAGIEVVLVAPMPPEIVGVLRPLGDDVEAERTAARDLRLLQASPDQPPPAELRLAIERPFMVPLRQALDRAPRTSRTTLRRRVPEGHAS